MTTTESTLPPLVAAKLRRLLGVEPTDPVPDRITPRQVVTLHHGQRVTIANKSAWNDCADIHDALMASGIVETETKTVVIDTGLFRPIPLATIGSTEWRAEFSRPDPATETATHTVVTRAALAEWWPCLGIEPGALLAAWMGIDVPEPGEDTGRPTPTEPHPKPRRVRQATVKDTLTPYALSLREREPHRSAKELLRIANRESGSPASPFQKASPGCDLRLKGCDRPCSASTWSKVISGIDTGKTKA